MLPDSLTDIEAKRRTASPLGFGPFGERPPIPANDQGSSLSRAVSEDLEAIFAEAPKAGPVTTPTPRNAPVRTLDKPVQRPSASRLTAIGGIIAAAIAGIVLGTFVVKQPPKAPPTPQVATTSAPTPTVADLATPRTAAPKIEAPAPKVVEPPAKVERAPVKAKAKAKPVHGKGAARAARPSRDQVLAADRELRQAYAAAGKAGVPRDRLVSIQRRWLALRGHALDQPGQMVAGYTALAAELRREAAVARVPSKRRLRGLFG